SRILFGTHTVASGIDAFFHFRHPKLETGTIASPFKTAYSMLEHRADEIALSVQEIAGGDLLKQSDISVQSDRLLIGSKSIGSSTLASIISVSPTAADIITDEIKLTGNLKVKEQIEAISLSAVDGECAYLFAARVQAGAVHAVYVSGLTAEFKRMYTLNANI